MINKIIGYKLKPKYQKYAKVCDELTKGWWTKNAENNFNKSGYHFAPELFTGMGIESNFKKAGVFEMWFEPVTEKINLKVGDWVVWKMTGYVGKIRKHCEVFEDSWNLRWDGKNDGEYSSCSELKLRLATLDEIKSVITPDIEYDGHKIIFNDDEVSISDLNIQIEPITFDRVNELLKMANSLNNDQINCICINTVAFTPEDITEIYEYYKELNDAKKRIS
jgi:hypothetical protein